MNVRLVTFAMRGALLVMGASVSERRCPTIRAGCGRGSTPGAGGGGHQDLDVVARGARLERGQRRLPVAAGPRLPVQTEAGVMAGAHQAAAVRAGAEAAALVRAHGTDAVDAAA